MWWLNFKKSQKSSFKKLDSENPVKFSILSSELWGFFCACMSVYLHTHTCINKGLIVWKCIIKIRPPLLYKDSKGIDCKNSFLETAESRILPPYFNAANQFYCQTMRLIWWYFTCDSLHHAKWSLDAVVLELVYISRTPQHPEKREKSYSLLQIITSDAGW